MPLTHPGGRPLAPAASLDCAVRRRRRNDGRRLGDRLGTDGSIPSPCRILGVLSRTVMLRRAAARPLTRLDSQCRRRGSSDRPRPTDRATEADRESEGEDGTTDGGAICARWKRGMERARAMGRRWMAHLIRGRRLIVSLPSDVGGFYYYLTRYFPFNFEVHSY